MLVAEVLRQRAVRERARWEEFNRRKREQEEAVERGRARLVPPSRPTAQAEARNDDDDGDGTTARADARSEQRHAAREHEEEEEDPMCRICFGGEEDGAHRTLSKCESTCDARA